jgi:hypothetical protein
MKSYVKSTLKPKTADQPDKQGPSHDDDGGARAIFPGEDDKVHMIFGGSPAVDGVFWYTKHVHYTLVWICLWN